MYAKRRSFIPVGPVASPRPASPVAMVLGDHVCECEGAAPRIEGRLLPAIRAGRWYRTNRSAVRPMYLTHGTLSGDYTPAALRLRNGGL
jgi:hypothetical protein